MKILVDGTNTWDELFLQAAHEKHILIFSNTSDLNEKNFPIIEKEKRISDLRLIPLRRDYPRWKRDAVILMSKQGLRPAYIEELFSYAREKPETQEKYHLIAMGSEWLSPRGRYNYPYLAKSFLGRYVGLTSLDRSSTEISLTKFLCVKL